MSSILKIRDENGNIIEFLALKGKDGKSAYEYAKEGGFTGTEEEFMNLIAKFGTADSISAGTFAGQVVANNAGQTPGTSLLRNSKLVSTETNPTVNGEICWTYE